MKCINNQLVAGENNIPKQNKLLTAPTDDELKNLKENISNDICKYYKNLMKRIYESQRLESPKPLEGDNLLDLQKLYFSDLSRIARFITYDALGLVLGGGGAKGAAHLGIIQAIRKENLPIDLVGGTSIGSLVSGFIGVERLLPCKEIEIDSTGNDEKIEYLYQLLEKFCDNLGSKFGSPKYLLPKVICLWLGNIRNAKISIADDEFLVKILSSIFENKHIKEFSIPYFCVSTNLSHSKLRVHCTGSASHCIRASMSLPYLLPPIPDIDYAILVDGGCLNNLPADIMKKFGAQHVIAVDIGARSEFLEYYKRNCKNIYNRSDITVKKNLPNLKDQMTNLSSIVACDHSEYIEKQTYCTYLNPEANGKHISEFDTMDFTKFKDVLELGINYGKNEEIIEMLSKKILKHIKDPISSLIQDVYASVINVYDVNQTKDIQYRELDEDYI
uniref:PNPLA domain-containing protein n=1 Tax=Acrobeloides nanus TaxID=290746 RepID=A0A914EDN0_9BILA